MWRDRTGLEDWRGVSSLVSVGQGAQTFSRLTLHFPTTNIRWLGLPGGVARQGASVRPSIHLSSTIQYCDPTPTHPHFAHTHPGLPRGRLHRAGHGARPGRSQGAAGGAQGPARRGRTPDVLEGQPARPGLLRRGRGGCVACVALRGWLAAPVTQSTPPLPLTHTTRTPCQRPIDQSTTHPMFFTQQTHLLPH